MRYGKGKEVLGWGRARAVNFKVKKCCMNGTVLRFLFLFLLLVVVGMWQTDANMIHMVHNFTD